MTGSSAADVRSNGEHPLADIDERVPVRVLAAAPGSDAGVLVRRLIATAKRPLGFVVADAKALEGAAVDRRRSDERLKILESGHACYVMRGHDLVEALNAMHLRRMGLTGDAVEYRDLVVQLPEAVEPLVVVFQLQSDSRLVLTYRFETLIGVIDASLRHRPADPAPPFMATVGRADGIVVTRADGAAAGDLAALKAQISAINPFVPVAVLPAAGDAAAELERMMFPAMAAWAEPARFAGAVAMTPASDDPRTRRIKCFANNPINDARSNEPSELGPVRAVHVRLAGHADIFKVSSMLAKIAERARGRLYRLRCTTAAPHADNPIEFRFVDNRLIHPSWSVPGATPETVLTVVGHHFDVADVMADVTACGWDADAVRRGEYNPF